MNETEGTLMSPPITITPQNALSKNSLGVFGVAFLVLAAVAPLTGIVVIAAIGIAIGNGGGMVASFLAVTVVLLLFGTGYARMSAELVSAGGFYAFVLRGLGRPAALGTGLVAMIGYNFFVAGAVGTIGFFAQTVIAQLTGVDLHWYLWAIISVIAAFAFSRKGIGFSAKVLGISLVCEVLILVIFDFAVLFTHGFDMAAFNPQIIFSGAAGIGFLFAGNAFVGVEATGLFSEEARDPKRTIPRATFVAIGFIGAFAAFTTWAIISATGVPEAQETALGHLEAGDLVFSLSNTYLGAPLTTVMMVLLLVSLFAALMALHNSATRYIFSLSRAGLLPRSLSRTRPNGVPERASIVQFVFAAAVAGIFAVVGLDPITSLVPSMTGFGTLGIITLQLLAALAIVVHFRRTRDPRYFSTLIAPGLGLVGLAVIVVLAIINFPVLAGSDAPLIGALPLLLLAALAGGLVWALHLRRKRPEVYEGLNDDLERFDEANTGSTQSPEIPLPTT